MRKNKTEIPSHVRDMLDGVLTTYGLKIDTLLAEVSASRDTEKETPRYLSESEAERLYGIGRWTLYRAARSGKIKKVKTAKAKSGKILFEKASIESWLGACLVSPENNTKEEEKRK